MIDLKNLFEDANGVDPRLSARFHEILKTGALVSCEPDVLAAAAYPLLLDGDVNPIPFAMDAFGDVFVTHEGGVVRVATESGDVGDRWNDLHCWAADLVSNPDEVVGYGFLQVWEEANGRIPEGHRLTPKMPFVFGGSYEISNIVSLPISAILEFRAAIARQIGDLPDGTRVLIDTE